MMLLPLQSVSEEILSDQHFYIVRLNLCLQNKIHGCWCRKIFKLYEMEQESSLHKEGIAL